MTVTATAPRSSHPLGPEGCPRPDEHGARIPVVFLATNRPDYVASAQMSFEEFLRLDYEGGLAEWVDGEVFLYMSVKLGHDRVVSFLHASLAFVFSYLGLGTVHLAGYPIRTRSGRAGREPDLFAVKPEHAWRLQAQFLDGAPDLVVEVVSDDSPERDRVVKFSEYEAAGIPEYWIIDPRPGEERASFYVLTEGRYVEVAPAADGVYTSPTFPAIRIRPEWLFAEEPPLQEAIALALGTRLPGP